jgi:hypothetical protein
MMMLCTRPTRLVGVLYCSTSLKQQYVDRHIVPLGPNILLPGQPLFALTP